MGTLMKCGCVSQGVCSGRNGVTFDPPIPACIVHECYDPADEKPNLDGRIAQCAYLPKGHAPKPSSLDLAFFEFQGEGSPAATDKCKCGYAWIAHQPRWAASIKVKRRWYKIDPQESVMTREFHAPPDLKEKRAEIEADFFRKQTHSENTKVYSAEVTSIRGTKNPLKCREFKAHGPHEFDKYYCGCRGWD